MSEVVDLLMSDLNVPELRDVCKDAGVSRKRGESKRDTAARLAKEAPDVAYDAVGMEPPVPGFTVYCPCGLEENVEEYDDAVSLAEEHSDECSKGKGVAGLGGLKVESEELGCAVWSVDEGTYPIASRVCL